MLIMREPDVTWDGCITFSYSESTAGVEAIGEYAFWDYGGVVEVMTRKKFASKVCNSLRLQTFN